MCFTREGKQHLNLICSILVYVRVFFFSSSLAIFEHFFQKTQEKKKVRDFL